MTRDVIIAGWGGVSPAGWSAAALADAVSGEVALPITEERRDADAPLRRFRAVPAMNCQPPWLRHARLRRSSPATRFAVSAAFEALASSGLPPESSGVVFVTMNGSVNFSRRFFAEVIENPAFASPILFPETVFNAPASHLSSVLSSPVLNYTLIGDSAQFLRGLDLAVQWLLEERVPHCLVVAAEELDWLSSEALQLFSGRRIAAEGAAAVCLKLGTPDEGIRLEQLTDAFLMSSRQHRAAAAARMHRELTVPDRAVVCDSRCGTPAWDAAESDIAPGARRCSVGRWLGDGFGVAAGWQSVVACELLHRGAADRAVVSAVGCSQQAIGAVFGRHS